MTGAPPDFKPEFNKQTHVLISSEEAKNLIVPPQPVRDMLSDFEIKESELDLRKVIRLIEDSQVEGKKDLVDALQELRNAILDGLTHDQGIKIERATLEKIWSSFDKFKEVRDGYSNKSPQENEDYYILFAHIVNLRGFLGQQGFIAEAEATEKPSPPAPA